MRRLCAAADNWRIRSCGGAPGRQASEPTEAPSRIGSAAWWEDFEPLGGAGGATRAVCVRARRCLLAPAAWLAERISGPVAKRETVEELAIDLDVAPRVVVDQLVRHRIARVRRFGWGGR